MGTDPRRRLVARFGEVRRGRGWGGGHQQGGGGGGGIAVTIQEIGRCRVVQGCRGIGVVEVDGGASGVRLACRERLRKVGHDTIG